MHGRNMYNSFLNNIQSNDITFSSGFEAGQSTIGRNDPIPFSIGTNIYPEVAFPSVDVQTLSVITCNRNSATVESSFLVCILPLA